VTPPVLASAQARRGMSAWRADLSELLGSGFLQNVLGTLGSRGVMLVIGVTTAVVVTRALGPDGRGLYATVAAVSAIGVQVGNLGLHASNTWAVARDGSLLGRLIGNSLIVSAAIGGLVAVGIVAIGRLWPGSLGLTGHLLLLTVLSIPIALSYLLLQNLLLGTGRVRVYNLLEVGTKAAALGLLVALVAAGMLSAFSAFAVVVLLTGIGMLVAWRLLVQGRAMSLRPSWRLLVEHARYGLKAYVAAMLAFLLLRVDVLIIQAMLGSTETGYYAVAVSLIDNMYILPLVIGSLLFPRLSALSDSAVRWRIAKSAAVGITIAMALSAMAAAVFGQLVIGMLFGQPFLPAVPAFVWLLPGLVLLSANTMLMNYFASNGMPLVVIVGPLTGLGVNVVLNIMLLPSIGIVGASVASSVGYGTMLMVSLAYLRRTAHARLSV
jgi:O-antigen/teichoic acid export membrane protein